MKLLLFIFCLTVAQASTFVYGQNISLHVKNESIEQVLFKISKQAKYDLVYDTKMLKSAGSVNLDLKDASLENALKQLFLNQPFEFEVKKNTIVIKSRSVNVRSNDLSLVQQKQVTGKVVDENGNPLIGVTVLVKGKPQIGTTTDGNGVYALLNLPENATLVYRYIGYLEQEISVGNQSSINVSLVVDQSGLEEVVVVGFGSQKKASVVASISTIKGEQLRMPNRSLSNNLAGQIPGIIAVQRSGEPGYDNAEFWIRGISSFAGGTSPLVLVDGVPRQLNDIEPDEIETFTLLKDASATSIYGSEGANGVILITAKRGREQRTNIAYRGEHSMLNSTRVPTFANSFDYLSLWNEGLINDGRLPDFSEQTLENYRLGVDPDLYPSVDWYNVLMEDRTNNMRHTLNFRGGGERMRYFVSGAYFQESGLYKVNNEYNNNAGLNRYNLRSNVDIDITKSTLLSVDLSGQYLKVNRPPFDAQRIFVGIYSTPPHRIPMVYSNGIFSYNEGGVISQNPYNDLMESGYRKEWRSAIQSKIGLTQRLDNWIEGLKVSGVVSYDSNSLYNMTRLKRPEAYFAEGRDQDGNLILNLKQNAAPFDTPITSNSGDKNIYIETALNYNRSFNRHDVGGMILYYQKERQLHNQALAFRKQAYVGRATYTFDTRYSVEGNFSVTGSEQFSDGYRFGFFPAIGVAWNFTNEHFFPSEWKNTLSSMKLRFSIGRTGNDNTGSDRFLYRPTFDSVNGYNIGIGSTASLNGVGTGIIEGRLESPTLSWEIEMKRNFGIDLSLFKGKVNIQADLFDNERTNILLQRRTVSGVAGFRKTPWQNFGIVTNKGVDGSVDASHNIGNVNVSVRGNFTFARNKIIEYDEIPQKYPWMTITGTRLQTLSGLVAERLFREDDFNISVAPDGSRTYLLRNGMAHFVDYPSPKPGDIKYKDQNGDGVVDHNYDLARDVMHPTIPEIIYGFGMNLAYKGVYLSAFFQGASNVSLNLVSPGLGQRTFTPFYEGIAVSNIRQEIIDNRWTEVNPSQDVLFPRISFDARPNTNITNSSWWYKDASFLRLKNVEVGYNLPVEKTNFRYFKHLRIYATGQNLFMWDKINLLDPELGQSGGGAQYPLPRIWTVGLDVTF